MKLVAYALLGGALLVSQTGLAERFIVEGDSVDTKLAAGVEVVKTFRAGKKTYTVVRASDAKYLTAQKRDIGASFGISETKVFVDLPIGLANPVVDDESDEPNLNERYAWHVEQMRYNELPAEMDGRNIIVAVLDTGVDDTHPALTNRMWRNEGEIPDNGIDDDNNGYVDDVMGYNFSAHAPRSQPSGGHGTHCAGIIASEKQFEDAEFSAQGAAPGAKIMDALIIGSASQGFLSDAAEAVTYAVDNGATVLSNSWRVCASWSSWFDEALVEPLREAILYANDKGAIFVAAAGNEYTDVNNHLETNAIYPVGYDNVPNLLSVSASDQHGELASFTNFGDHYVHVAAPGVDIISTLQGGSWGPMSGTSMATPLVAGLVARSLSANMEHQSAFDLLEQTSNQSESWTGKVRAGGVVNPKAYFDEH